MRIWLLIEYEMTFLLVFFWWMVYAKAKGLLRSHTEAALRSNIRKVHLWLYTAIAMTGIKVGAVIMLWSTDWAYVEDKIMIQLPLYLLSIAAIFTFSLPFIKAAAADSAQSMEGQLKGDLRLRLHDPVITIPFAAAFIASVVNCLHMLLFSQSPLRFGTLFLIWSGFVVCAATLWYMKSRVYERIAASGAFPPIRSLRQRLVRTAIVSLSIAALLAAIILSGLNASRLPDRMNMADHGGHSQHAADPASMISVDSLKGPQSGAPDRIFTLSAQTMERVLPSGETEEVWAFNQLIPGPELRIKEGELIEVNLVNVDIEKGVTLHWHGLNVPNGEDGVAGLTQDAVLPGERHKYRFIAEQTGTYWYHSHQQSSVQVAKGLYGALVVETQASDEIDNVDLAVVSHQHGMSNGTTITLGLGKLQRIDVRPETPVRLRLINARNMPQSFYLSGVPFRVTAIDGIDLHEPQLISNQNLSLAAGGRYDLSFQMPSSAVGLAHSSAPISEDSDALVLAANGQDLPPAFQQESTFDPAAYGTPAVTPFNLETKFDQSHTLVLDNRIGFYNGKLTNLQTINGYVFPHTPSLMVREGDAVKVKFVNRGFMDHPMHLHGHHILVLSRNDKPVKGSPWWTDTLNVAPGEIYETAFLADNPGLWMDHCHNLDHAAAGMSMHLMYEGVYTPYDIGTATANLPE